MCDHYDSYFPEEKEARTKSIEEIMNERNKVKEVLKHLAQYPVATADAFPASETPIRHHPFPVRQYTTSQAYAVREWQLKVLLHEFPLATPLEIKTATENAIKDGQIKL